CVFPDEHYHTWPAAMSAEDLASGEYLRPLTPDEELALFLATRGHCLEDNGRLGEARHAYARAAVLAPASRYHRQFLAAADAEIARRRSPATPATSVLALPRQTAAVFGGGWVA